MLAASAPFPHVGSRAFIGTTAEPATIIRTNADRTALIRVDPRPNKGRNRDASGNRTEPLANLFATEDAAARAGLPARGKPRRASKGAQ